MRIAYVCADLGVPVFGRKGCSIHVQEVVRELTRRGAQVELFAVQCEGSPPPGLEEVTLHPLSNIPKGNCAAREQAALAMNQELLVKLEQEGPFDLVYERYSLWSFAGMEYASSRGVPGLLEVNAPLIDEQAEHRTLVDRAGAEHVAERAFRAASALVAVSSGVAEYLERYPAARGRVHTIPNGVDPGRFPPDQQPSCPAPAGIFTVGFVGTLKPWHGLTTLIDAFAQFHRCNSNTRLLIVGDGPERHNLEEDLASRGIGRAAHFAGSVAPEQIAGFLVSMDVAVAPYPKLSNFYFSPLKVYEYMAAGLPPVVSRVGQLAELIQHEVNGYFCPPGDAQALTAALMCLRDDPLLRDRLGRAARTTVLREHTWESTVQRLLCLAGFGQALQLPPLASRA